MFENFVFNIKSQTSKVSENVRSTFKNRSSKVSNTLSPRNQENINADRLTMGGTDQIVIERNPLDQRKKVLKWPVLVDNQIGWLTIQPNNPSYSSNTDDDAIIEKYLKVSTPEEVVVENRRNDREEIRRRLAMGPEADDCFAPGRKPSLQSRLQSGMNLQICFMNDTLSDGESPSGSDESPSPPLSSSLPSLPHPPLPSSRDLLSSSAQTAADNVGPAPPRTLSLKSSVLSSSRVANSLPMGGVVGKWDIFGSSGSEEQPACQSLKAKWEGDDFFGRQARLQAEARVALVQAKEMAHMQMEVERQRLKANSPITQMVRASLLKVGLVFPVDRRRVSRQMLTEMNVAQLQVIVNDLHTQIEVLNEDLVKLLMERDDLHMEQDSMLVDIEDLTRYLGAKEKALKESGRDPGSGSARGGDSGAVGSLPSLPLIFRHNGGHSKLSGGQSNRPRIGLLSKK